MVKVGFKSDKGKIRKNNEDSCFVLPHEQIYIIADGVGGANAGEKASYKAVSSIANHIKNHPMLETSEEVYIKQYLDDCVEIANRQILSCAEQHSGMDGMATTIVICYIKDNYAYFISAGDSRGYLYKNGELLQTTQDNSYVNELLQNGKITEEEARKHSELHVITKALGVENVVNADFTKVEIQDEDIIILCTDGLYGELSTEDMNEIISRNCKDMTKLAEDFINFANLKGGRDNITAICLRIEGGILDEQ